ncbi:MAG: hypothetical protein GTO30_07520 [Acidobacteria bacterium]|nr:hypothetical protein [Acidobacteriota bacterium]NIM61494.1 hypothetical protein [Acidobacteriota bacterium]NIO58126.1 hypothetical protein [Acidobacteriota bacterium]NIQ83689.1 hypothetical protein [Acidobacteriota bacterium]NIT09860.1 hypothetical protein [Acidobacteriota bacterium]
MPQADPLRSRRPRHPAGRLRRAVARDLAERGTRGFLRKAVGRLRYHAQLARYELNLRRLTGGLSRARIDRPVFVLGVQGGGLTVLARCLYRHPRVVYASGNSEWWAGPDEIHNCPHIRDLPEPLVHRSFHFKNVTSAVENHPRFGYQRSWLYAVDELLSEHRKTAEDADEGTTRGLHRVLRKLLTAYAHDPLTARIVDMSQLYTIQVPYIARMLERFSPMFVIAARNPYAVCARAVAKEYVAAHGCPFDDPEMKIACAVEHWTNSFRLALDDTRGLPRLIVRYEDFMADPEAVVREIDSFAGLEFDARQIPAPGQPFPLGSLEDNKWYPLRAGENERYLKALDPALVRALNARAGDLLKQLGYERIEA